MSKHIRAASRLARVIGHRGAAAHAPENTLSSLHAAAVIGAAMVEVDVKLTADSVPILIHDERLDRTTNGHGAVRHAPWRSVRQCDAGTWFDPAFSGERIPSLEEALTLAASLGLAVNLELKPCRGREQETARATMAVVHSLWPGTGLSMLVSSFSKSALAAVARIAPIWPRSLLVGRPRPGWLLSARQVRADYVAINHRYASARLVGRCHAQGFPVLAYTVNDPIRARVLYELGISSLFSDWPDRIKPA